LAPRSAAGSIAIWANSIHKWKPPHAGQDIDQEKRAGILENIRRAIRFAGDDVEIIG